MAAVTGAYCSVDDVLALRAKGPLDSSVLTEAQLEITIQLVASEMDRVIGGNYVVPIAESATTAYAFCRSTNTLGALSRLVDADNAAVSDPTAKEGNPWKKLYQEHLVQLNSLPGATLLDTGGATGASGGGSGGGGGGVGSPRGAGAGLGLSGNDLYVLNPFTADDETKLDGLAAVEGNPTGSPTRDLTAIEIAGVIYDIPTGGGGGGGGGDITAVTAGDGLTGGGVSGEVRLDVNPGDGIEVVSDKVRVKLDGSTLNRDQDGLSVTNPFTDADETKLDGIAEGAEVNVQADLGVTSTGSDAFVKNKDADNIAVDASGFDGQLATTDTDVQKVAQKLDDLVIPTVPARAGAFTADDESKLDGIEAGAEVNVQADLGVTSTGSDAFVKNKDADNIAVDASGFDGQLATTDTDVQKVAQKLDDLTIPTVPARAGAFTADDESKLDGIEAGAEVNPPHIRKFSATDNDTQDSLDSGEIGFSSTTATFTQVQSGSLGQTQRIDIARRQATFGQDPTNPVTPLGAQDVTDLFGELLDHGGSVILAMMQGSRTAYVQAETVTAYGTHGWTLTNLTWVDAFAVTGSGVAWNIVAGPAYGFLLQDGIGLLPWAKLAGVPDFVRQDELEGTEQDRYASYTNAFMAASYRRGSISLFHETTVPTDDTNAVRQPDIADRSTNGVIAFSTFLRTDRDPNNLVWAAEATPGQYPSGTVLYISIWNYPAAHVKVTLTSNATQAGSGDAAFLWATATWDEVNDIPDVVEYGNYFKIALYEPTDLKLRLPASDILDPPWVDTDGSNVTQAVKDAVQGDNESVLLSQQFRVDTTNVEYYVARTVASKQLRIRLPSSAANTQIDEDLKRLLQPAAWVDIGGWRGDITTNATRSIIGTSLTFSFNYDDLGGTFPTGSTPVDVEVIGEDVHRGQLVRPVFVAEDPNIAGKGGTSGQVWTRGSTDEDADWADAGGGGGGAFESFEIKRIGTCWIRTCRRRASGRTW